MASTEKISVTIGRNELRGAKRLASRMGLSLSTFISDAVRERIEHEARTAAGMAVLRTFAPEDLASSEEMVQLLEHWRTPQPTTLKSRPAAPRAARRKTRTRNKRTDMLHGDGNAMFHQIDVLKRAGFAGFKRIAELRRCAMRGVPDHPGVYLVLWTGRGRPGFAETSVGGWFKKKDPSVPVAQLERRWVDGSIVLYIGKADGGGHASTLSSRIGQHLAFGEGQPVAGWGGRFIWQLEEAESLVVCWQALSDDEPRSVGKSLLAAFRRHYGRLPFANLRG